MSNIKLKGNSVHTIGNLPAVGTLARDFSFVKNDLSEAKLSSLKSHYKILNIFPSIDTGTCAMSVRQFNKRASEIADTTVLCISMDLPFALARFCGAEGIENVTTASVFRSDFATSYGVEMVDGPLKGLLSRAVVILGNENEVLYTEQVGDIVDEPDYEKALAVFNRK